MHKITKVSNRIGDLFPIQAWEGYGKVLEKNVFPNCPNFLLYVCLGAFLYSALFGPRAGIPTKISTDAGFPARIAGLNFQRPNAVSAISSKTGSSV